MAKPKFRSKFEAKAYSILKKTLGKGYKIDYEADTIKYLSKVVSGLCDDCKGTNVWKKRRYVPDFRITHKSKVWYIETKGRLTSADRTKLSNIKQQTSTPILLWFQRNNKTGTKAGTYIGWAKTLGIPAICGLDGIRKEDLIV